MHFRIRFSTLVFVAALAWATLAGVLALSTPADASSSQSKTFAGTFQTSAVVFAAHPNR